MSESVRVALLGTGHMGSGIGRLILQREGLELVGAAGKRKNRAGLDLGEALGLDRSLGIVLAGSLRKLLRESRPQVVIQATCSRVKEAYPEIEAALRSGANVISIAEEMSFPYYGSPELAEKLDNLSRRQGVTVLGTGINPGFVLDTLVIVLTGVCMEVRSITAERVNDLSPYGPSVLKTQGVGLTPEDFERGLAEGTVVGHFGFPESISLIARALGWEIDRIEQTRKPIISKVRRQTEAMTIEPGYTAGCEHIGIGYRSGEPAITLIHPQQVHPEAEGVQTGDRIRIKGVPDIDIATTPEIPGGIGTIALAVNMIPRVLEAAPGLKTMADLPIPAAFMGGVKRLLGRK